MRNLRVAGQAIVILTLAAGAGHAGPPLYTEAWEGDWSFHQILRVCEVIDIVDEMDLDITYCAGDPLYGESVWTCSGTLSDESLEVTCTLSDDVSSSCSRTRTIHQSYSLNGDTITGLQILTTEYLGEDCTGYENTCEEFARTGSRESTPPDCTETPLRPTTWTDVKVRFR